MALRLWLLVLNKHLIFYVYCAVEFLIVNDLCVPGVQKGTRGGNEGKDGDRPKDEKVPPLDEE